MAIPAALKQFPNPVKFQEPDLIAIITRNNDNVLAAKVNDVITEITAIESGTSPSGLSPFLLMGG